MQFKELSDHLLSLELTIHRSRAATIKELSDHYRQLVNELTRLHVAELEAVEQRHSRMLKLVGQARNLLQRSDVAAVSVQDTSQDISVDTSEETQV